MNGRSERPDRAEGVPRGAAQWILPFGQHHASANYGPQVVAHMAKYGTTTTDFGHLTVTPRKNASLNTKAQMRTPITMEDHENSPWVTWPFRLLDCCLQTDGACAMVVTSSERARDLKQAPVYIMSIMGGATEGEETYHTYAETAAPQLYEGAGITPRDVDVAELYDPFSAASAPAATSWMARSPSTRTEGCCPRGTCRASATSSRRSNSSARAAWWTISARASIRSTAIRAGRSAATPRSRSPAVSAARAPSF
jgi:hypothetical protein